VLKNHLINEIIASECTEWGAGTEPQNAGLAYKSNFGFAEQGILQIDLVKPIYLQMCIALAKQVKEVTEIPNDFVLYVVANLKQRTYRFPDDEGLKRLVDAGAGDKMDRLMLSQRIYICMLEATIMKEFAAEILPIMSMPWPESTKNV